MEGAKKGDKHYIDANLRSDFDLEAPEYATKAEFDNFVSSKATVVSIGNSSSLGSENDETYASGLGKIIGYEYRSLIHNAKTYKGNSGGGAFNEEGKIIGIHRASDIYDKDNLNITDKENAYDLPYSTKEAYAVPSYIAKQFADKAIELESQAGNGPSPSLSKSPIKKLPSNIKSNP